MLKKLCCLLLLAGAAPLAHAQTRPAPVKVPAPARGSVLEATATKEHDTMVIELTDAPMVIWRRLAQVLAVRGYAIEHSSPELLTLATYPLEVRSSRIRIAGMVEGRTLMVRAYAVYQNEGYPEINQRARCRGGDNAEWEELAAIGQQLGGTIRYTTSAAPQ
ncbi:hypothetical protein [Hymenobacter sp. APR13]|uniref:hypothetical protein n=1 Tax=Hymenobacter sp. APR13 TaxID=1356852 RepID=UPI0004E02D49|nr:hypothetical protein [Hymenobacter sp. APR13]AII54169.1 hypothetical protein N008_19550 [Hymenobacter sp. APR13]